MSKFTFIGDFGRETLTYKEYIKNKTLRNYIRDPQRAFLNLGKTLLSYDRKWLLSHPSENEAFLALKGIKEDNQLQFFCPSTIKTTAAINFPNATENTVSMIIAPNRVGKSTTALIKLCLDLIPTDPNWEIFAKNGVKWRPWNGPVEVGMATYQWNMMFDILWPELKRWLPKHEWATTQEPNKVSPQKKLACGSVINMRVYEQDQQAFESGAYDRWLWDEQAKRQLFDGGDERTRTKRGRHYFALTPHAVDGRPDTGGGSWIEDLDSGKVSIGVPVKSYTITVEDVPDWVYPEESKKAAYVKWIEGPKQRRDFRMLAEGESRFYGKWHRTQGRLFDQISEEVHLIDDFKIPANFTRYRAIDHGLTNPFACICAAVSPPGWTHNGITFTEPLLFFYREILQTASSVSEICRVITDACGNDRRKLGSFESQSAILARYEELMITERFAMTALDSRSMANKDPSSGMVLGDLYNLQGIRCTPASGKDERGAIDIIREYFAPVDGQHPFRKDLDVRPRSYIFRSLTNLWRQIVYYQERRQRLSDINKTEKAHKKDDHLIDALKYLVQIPPRYVEGTWYYEEGDEYEDEQPTAAYRKNRYTGY